MGEYGDLFPEVRPHCGNEDENQRFTISRAKDWCLRIAGVREFTLDVAACAESHHAHLWYGQAEDGLRMPWFGDVFCNPPWDNIGAWVEKAWYEMRVTALISSISMLLPGDRTHRPWWRELVEPFRDGRDFDGPPLKEKLVQLSTHFAPERFPYGSPGNPRGIGVAEPNFTSCLLLWKRYQPITIDGEVVPGHPGRASGVPDRTVLESPLADRSPAGAPEALPPADPKSLLQPGEDEVPF